MKAKVLLQNVALVLISVVLSYGVLEAGFRYYWYDQLKNQLVTSLFKLGQHGNIPGTGVFDSDTGYRYIPNQTWEHSGGIMKNRWRTNRHGLIANEIDPTDYPVEKPPGEFRIALLGDSFTASNAVYIRWSDLLQDYLNRSPKWKDFVGNKFTRVLNFGMDGTGVTQWASVYEFNARHFSPDMAIVNIFVDDIMRIFVYRGRYAFRSDAELRAFVEGRVANSLARMDWFGIYPELLAATVGEYIDLPQRLRPTTEITNEKFASAEEAVRNSIASLQRIRCLNPRTVVLYTPAVEEVLVSSDDRRRWPSNPELVGLQTKFQQAMMATGIPLVELAKINPLPPSRLQILALYNGPIDTHMSDYGVAIYAAWLFKYLLEWSHTAAAIAPPSPPGCS